MAVVQQSSQPLVTTRMRDARLSARSQCSGRFNMHGGFVILLTENVGDRD